MRASTALLARRLVAAGPRLLGGGEASGAAAVASFGLASPAVAASAFALAGTSRAWHASPAAARAADAATASTSSPLNCRTECGDVPDGHKETDLSHHVNNIGLGRRRDLTLRADVRLFGPDHAAGDGLEALLKVRVCECVWRHGQGLGGRGEDVHAARPPAHAGERSAGARKKKRASAHKILRPPPRPPTRPTPWER